MQFVRGDVTRRTRAVNMRPARFATAPGTPSGAMLYTSPSFSVPTALAKGALALNDYARANDPFAQVGKVQVGVDVASVIRASASSFRIAWVERRYQDGSLAETTRWSAIVTVTIQPPKTPDALRKNPLGLFVNAINWSKELGQ